MKSLWTPWRIAYILGEKPEGCLFCLKQQGSPENDRENYILYRGQTCFVMLNLFPYTSGHVLVAPYKHAASPEQLSDKELLELMTLVGASVATLRKAMSPAGFNIGMNLGRVAGAGVPDHVHMHVVPRWMGDANFMSVLGDTRLINESIDRTYETLFPILMAELHHGD